MLRLATLRCSQRWIPLLCCNPRYVFPLDKNPHDFVRFNVERPTIAIISYKCPIVNISSEVDLGCSALEGSSTSFAATFSDQAMSSLRNDAPRRCNSHVEGRSTVKTIVHEQHLLTTKDVPCQDSMQYLPIDDLFLHRYWKGRIF